MLKSPGSRSHRQPSPKPGPHPQAEAAGPEAVPAVAEAEMTLRELQEALEEEVLTRQSLSRELEAIRTANQSFARSGSARPGPVAACRSLSPRGPRAHGPSLPAVSSARPRPGTGTWRRKSGCCRSRWSSCRQRELQASP